MSSTVLVIDDEVAIATALSVRLRAAGYHVLTAFDGAGGLASAAAGRPDLILLDIRLPDLDGFEVHRRLKADPETTDTPVVFLSAHAQDAVRQAALAAGAALFVPKPYDNVELLSSIRDVLATSAGRSVGDLP